MKKGKNGTKKQTKNKQKTKNKINIRRTKTNYG